MPADLLFPGVFFACLACLGMYLIAKSYAPVTKTETVVGLVFILFGGVLLAVLCFQFLPAGGIQTVALVAMEMIFAIFCLVGMLTLIRSSKER